MFLVRQFKKGIVIAVDKLNDSEKNKNIVPPGKRGWLILFSMVTLVWVIGALQLLFYPC